MVVFRHISVLRGFMTHLYQLVGMLLEHLRVLLHITLITGLGRLHQHQQWHVGLQEGITHVVHHRLAQLYATATARSKVNSKSKAVVVGARFMFSDISNL